jgi:uncharacterized membrane protein/protein-disulfide isomerase
MRAGKIALILFAILGLGINLLLLLWKLTDPSNGVVGCGGAGACNEVLASKWSQVFGLPITIPGALIYALILFSQRPRFEKLLSPSLAILTGGVIWFVSVQLWILHHLCPWCLAAHVIGVIVVILGVMQVKRSFFRSMIVGVVATGLLIAAQVFGPAPATHRIEETTAAIISVPIHTRGDGRKIEFNNGRKIYDRDALPSIGSSKATHVLVEYFDYRCAACRVMHGFLDSLIGKHPDQIAIIMLPLEGADQHERPGNTSLSRIALAVWRTEPAKFPEIHRTFFSLPAPDEAEAMRLAANLISRERLDAALKDPWIDELLAANAEDRISFSKKTPQLPKLLVKGTRLVHGLPSSEADFIRVMEQELGL